eukprot:COSAG02_NODE_999_length_15328_cov_8.086360_15_plen_40_part_00
MCSPDVDQDMNFTDQGVKSWAQLTQKTRSAPIVKMAYSN